MKLWVNGITREMTAEEVAVIEEMNARHEAQERKRPLTLEEVNTMLIKAQINTLAVDDQTAIRMIDYYPEWETGKDYPVGYKVTYQGDLYKVIQAHTSQETWTPGTATAALYARIDETHDGSKYDPIPYNGNMALTAGLYYTQDGVTYLCNRDTGNPVYNALSELVGIYVTVVETI